jgi:hypothetical protein
MLTSDEVRGFFSSMLKIQFMGFTLKAARRRENAFLAGDDAD